MKLIAPVVLVVLFLSCSKKDSLIARPPVPDCRIVSAHYTGGQLEFTYNLSYDSNGRLSKLTYDGPTAFTKTFSYSGNFIYINMVAIDYSATDTIALNTAGLIATHKETTKDTVYNTVFSYDANGQVISSTTQKNNIAPVTTYYTFTNGDLTNTLSGNLKDTTTYAPDKPAVKGNLDDFNQLIYYGSFYYKNKHLKDSFSSWPYHYNFTYTYDEDGKITSVVSNNGTISESFSFTYECD